MRLLLVVEIEGVTTGSASAVIGAIRESLERYGLEQPQAGVGMTAHVGDAAERIAAAVRLELGPH